MSNENVNVVGSDMSDKQESAEYMTPDLPSTSDSQSLWSLSDVTSIGQKEFLPPRRYRHQLEKVNKKLTKIGLSCNALKQKRRLSHTKTSSALLISLMKKQRWITKGKVLSTEMNMMKNDDGNPSTNDLPNETAYLSCSEDSQGNSNKAMLSNWRSLIEVIKNLNMEYESLKLSTVNAKNQLHVYNSLIRAEKRHTEELLAQINRTAAETLTLQKSLETLRLEIEETEASKAALNMHLETKQAVVGTLKKILEKSKTDLKKSQQLANDLEHQLNVELAKQMALKETNQHLKDEKVKILCEMSKLEEVQKAVLDTEKTNMKIALEELTEMQQQVEKQTEELEEQNKALQQLQDEVNALRDKAQALRTQMVTTFGNRVHQYMHKMLGYKKTLAIVHCVAAHFLPGVPPPKVTAAKLPITVTWEQALKLIKR